MLACLEAARGCGGHVISIGGAIGLFHYVEYRQTKDLDAWWTEEATEAQRFAVIQAIKGALAPFGSVEERRFGDVVSIELLVAGKVEFSFQIARRSALLRPLQESSWPPVLLDSLEDLMASKMQALVERGAPRDFLDIHRCCLDGLGTVPGSWALWREREIRRGTPAPDVRVAREAILLHLSRIERQRPLESIIDREARGKAAQLREWFKHEFCG